MTIPIEPSITPRLDRDAVRAGTQSNLPSDHMFLSEFANGVWQNGRIEEYGPIPILPFALGMQYAQSVFEGMKAYRYKDGRVAVFRMERHQKRFNKSLARMVMPDVPSELFTDAITTLVDLDQGWVPNGPDRALYIRPYVFATEERVGLKAADEFTFFVLTGPFRAYFNDAIRVKIERTFVRASPGGVGAAKCAGNYGAALYASQIAKDEGFDQLLWTDATTHTKIEESGAMNVMFVIDGALVTPPLSDTILDGVTRDSILRIARDAGIRVEERAIEVVEIQEGIKSGSVTEAFGVGTAAIVAPIGTISIDGVDLTMEVTPDAMMFKLKKTLNDIRYGRAEDVYNWMTVIG
jgi:branched-chain amino acid aminotransferase